MNERLAQELNALRGRYNMSQTQLGAVIGVTQSQMSKRLKGGVPFTLDEVETLASYFGMTPMQLLGEAETPRPGGGSPSLVPAGGSSTDTHQYPQVTLLRAAA
jgi:transcriptional regulator with XRE-family HTH domain